VKNTAPARSRALRARFSAASLIVASLGEFPATL
jgi:hypothetical protein